MGFGNELKLDLDRHISDAWFFRSQSLVNRHEDEHGTLPEQHISLVHRSSSDRYVTLDWRNVFSTRPGYQVDETQLRLRYRRSIRWKWLFLEIRPTLAFPEEPDYETSRRLKLRMKALFGVVDAARRD